MTDSNFAMQCDNIIMTDWVTARVETLENKIRDDDENREHNDLIILLDKLCGSGDHYKWRDNWYPSELVRDSHFYTYAVDFAYETGAVKEDNAWPNNCIDWDKAARQLQDDFSPVKFRGITYWARIT
jgi:hypothetical protein